MNAPPFLGILNNAAFLLALAVLYDILPFPKDHQRRLGEALTGFLIGLIGIAVMLLPWRFSQGIVFDTRSILLSITGLFFGPIPTLIAASMTGLLRLSQGGAGAPMGIAVILTSAALGLAWQPLTKKDRESPKWYHLYSLGIVVHFAMLLWTVLLPAGSRSSVLMQIWFPVMVIYPAVTVLLGLLLAGQRQRRQWGLLFRTLFELSPDAVVLIDPHDPHVSWPIVDCNLRARQMNGYSREELVGHSIDILNVAPGTSIERQDYLERIRSAGILKLETAHRHKDGTIFPIEVSTSLIKIGERELIMGIDRDITERKRAQEALYLSERRYATLVEASPAGIFRTDAAGKTTYVSPRWCEISGLEAASALGDGWLQAVHPQDRPLLLSGWQDAAQARSPSAAEYRFVRPDGSVRWVIGQAIPETDFQGQVTGYVGVILDATAQKEAEEALHAAEARLRAVVEQVSLVVYTEDAQGGHNTLYINPQIETLSGYSPEEWLNQPDFWKKIIHPADLARVVEEDQSTDQSGSPFEMEYRIITRSGETRWVQDRAVLIRDRDEQPLYWQGFMLDITDRKRAEQTLQEYNARLESEVAARAQELREAHEQLLRQERLAALGQLAGSVAHELRNPLGVISNAVYYLRTILTDAPDKVAQYLNIIADEMRLADQIITELLDFSRHQSLQPQPTNVADLIRQALERFPPPEKIRVATRLPSDLPAIFVDARQIGQVLGNLIVNAYQAMPEGGELALSARTQGSEIRIAVQDTGVGIPPENLPKLFEPLFTTKARGIGLGLSVCKKYIEANGGRIEVESTPGAGATFTVVLPIVKEVR